MVGSALPFVLSGRHEGALRAQAERLHTHLTVHPELELGDVAFSLATTRARFEQRAVVVASEREGLLQALPALGRGEPWAGTASGRASGAGKVVFVFPGQGSQWTGMGRALLEQSAVFRASIEACERALSPHVSWSLSSVLRDEAGSASLERVDVVQPVLFAMMVGLAELLRSLGVEADAVVGHSQGEIAAACVSGALSLEDGARVVAVRARLLSEHVSAGAMAAVELGEAEVRARIERYGAALSIAAVNGPESTLVSGEPQSVQELDGTG